MAKHYFSEWDHGKKRKIQEDSHLAEKPINPNSPIEAVLLIADGMGGHSAGEVASGMVRKQIDELFVRGNYINFAKRFGINPNSNKAEFYNKIVRELLFYLNKQIKNKAQQIGKESMGTTCTLALIFKSQKKHYRNVIIAHVGDSRGYKISNKGIKQITEDDSLVWQMYKAGKINKSELNTHNQKNVITQALGGEELNPHVYNIKLRKDETLLLCSDGLHGMVSDKRILHIYKKNNTLSSIGEELITSANNAGGKDNISIALYSDSLEAEKSSEDKKSRKVLFAVPIITIISFMLIFAFLIDLPSKLSLLNDSNPSRTDKSSNENLQLKTHGELSDTTLSAEIDMPPSVRIKGENAKIPFRMKIQDNQFSTFDNHKVNIKIDDVTGVDPDDYSFKIKDAKKEGFSKQIIDDNTIEIKKKEPLKFADATQKAFSVTVFNPNDDYWNESFTVKVLSKITNPPPPDDNGIQAELNSIKLLVDESSKSKILEELNIRLTKGDLEKKHINKLEISPQPNSISNKKEGIEKIMILYKNMAEFPKKIVLSIDDKSREINIEEVINK